MLRFALATALFLAAGPALAQQPTCFPYADIASALDAEAHETPVARMLDSRGRVVEILATADGSTYTILIVAPEGMACAVSVGSAYAVVPAVAAPAPGTGS
jgi:hypothetical protein